jgi:hypothetical protein
MTRTRRVQTVWKRVGYSIMIYSASPSWRALMARQTVIASTPQR